VRTSIPTAVRSLSQPTLPARNRLPLNHTCSAPLPPGVGFVGELSKQPSRRCVTDALKMLDRMSHRGACGCEENTGAASPGVRYAVRCSQGSLGGLCRGGARLVVLDGLSPCSQAARTA